MLEKKRLGTIIAKAYAHAMLHKHYFAWLFDYKINHPGTTLMTMEYDMVQGSTDDSENQRGMLTPTPTPPTLTLTLTLFCSDLDMVQVSVMGDSFKLLLDAGKMVNEHKAANEHAETSITEEIRHRINEDRPGNGDTSSKLTQYSKMITKLEQDAAQLMMAGRKST